ncbi:universal stress protein UspA1 [Methanobrevibacter sp. 87.7]|uniref:universal stress protein n=1 Tax=Methanobrevibacter sp. 87.7 TaxID=387957 RepID=UPI000B502EDE|nr:universal stress protein [Methanobrevibacter sp. 87.7]OWT33788.1 universal stress protein UspA1 [Methanobrevibacter sp. 87.7]
MFSKILIASDGSDTANKAIDVGVNIASKYNADIAALYIIDPFKMSFDDGDGQGGAVLDSITDKGHEHNLKVVEHIITADPINDFKVMIQKIDPDLVVIGQFGNSLDNSDNEYEKNIGSVAAKVLEVSPVPVLLVK